MLYIVLLILEIFVIYFLSRRVVKAVYRLFYKVTKRKNLTMYLYAIIFLPGTFIHEVSHFLTALFLLVPVGKMELYPIKKEDGKGFGLGSVAIAKTDPVRRFLIGVAPLIFGLSIIFLLLYYFTVIHKMNVWWVYLLIGFLVFQIANSMFASKKDLEGAVVLLILFVLILIILILFGVDIINLLTGVSFSSRLLEILKLANIFFLVPIIIDTLVLLLFKKK